MNLMLPKNFGNGLFKFLQYNTLKNTLEAKKPLLPRIYSIFLQRNTLKNTNKKNAAQNSCNPKWARFTFKLATAPT